MIDNMITAWGNTRLVSLQVSRFKTSVIHMMWLVPLARHTASGYALVPEVLRQGCDKYPAMTEVSCALEDLCGASLSISTERKGYWQTVEIQAELLSSVYAGQAQISGATELIHTLFLDRKARGQGINSEILRIEKVNLIQNMDNRINDKRQLAYERCVETIAGEEAFGIHEWGERDTVDSWEPETLEELWFRMVEEAPLTVTVMGDISQDEWRLLERVLRQVRPSSADSAGLCPVPVSTYEGIRTSVDIFDVNQAKLCLGYATGTASSAPDYPALMAAVSVLGGGVHSRFFRNIREKHSVAYYIAAGLDKFLGTLWVQTAIDPALKSRVMELIAGELQELTESGVPEEELTAAVSALSNSLRGTQDSLSAGIQFACGQWLGGTSYSVDSLISALKQVTPEAATRALRRVRLQSVSYVGPQEVINESR